MTFTDMLDGKTDIHGFYHSIFHLHCARPFDTKISRQAGMKTNDVAPVLPIGPREKKKYLTQAFAILHC